MANTVKVDLSRDDVQRLLRGLEVHRAMVERKAKAEIDKEISALHERHVKSIEQLVARLHSLEFPL